ncbi:hypothetical protein IMZ48_37140 [Candidatus Bathyarchaeota archaeon]|nr:hypothetical protein [Candidatus Bathyarchaeota archaeon]
MLTEDPRIQLSCSSYLSFVPQADSNTPDPALISNSLYKEALDNLLAQKFEANEPGFDYTWLLDQYPVPAHADLGSQVSSFLASRRPRDPPKETLWVFDFGAWDVWTLSALPREFAETVVDYMVLHLFEQIELLYRTSLSDSSIAFSDFWGYSSPDVIRKLQGGQLTDARPEMETFRVLIPETLDVSMTPGWQSERPRPPPPHSLPVHMTNALYLTDRWNAAVRAHTTEWEKLPHPTAEEVEVDTVHRAEARMGKRGAVERVEEPLYAPYPRRKALLFNAPEFVLEAMIEKQMHDTKLNDTTGRGTRPESDPLRFSEVAKPCVGAGKACGEPDQYLFQTPFSLTERGMREVARRGAAEAREALYLEDSKPEAGQEGGEFKKADSSRRDV